MTTSEILEFVRLNRQYRWVDLTGGEIFLREDLEEIVFAMLKRWSKLALLHYPTNGYLTDRVVDVTARLAAESPVEIVVTVSLDGDRKLNDRIRGIRGGFDRQIETFRRLREIRNVSAVIGMTLSTLNLGEFESTFRACQSSCPGLTINDFHLNVMQLSNHYYQNDVLADHVPSRDQALQELRKYRSFRRFPTTVQAWVENRFLSNLDLFIRDGKTPMKCHSLRSSCFIDPEGTVYPCISYSRPVGCLRDHGMDLRPIWNSHVSQQLAAEIRSFDCPQCWTACEANHTIIGNLLRPDARRR